jgi:pimeloyl-ACP methyl ester carboxylesterase
MTATITIDGTRIAYDDAGQGAPPVLLVHGWCGDRSQLAPQFDHFRRTHRTVAVDRAGHGESGVPADGDLRVTRHADDLARLCDELGLHQPVVVMHSMDRIVLDLAGRYPDLPGGVVIIDGPTLAPGYDEMGRDLVGPLRSEAYQDVIRGFADQVAFLPTDDGDVRERALACMLRTPQEVMASSWEAFIDYDPVPAIGRISAPVLHIQSVFPADLDRFAELCPQLVTGKVVGAGHFAPLLVPDQVNAMIDAFIATSVPAPASVSR